MIKGSKICGIKDPNTLNFIINYPHPPNFIGFICNYPKSSRYVSINDLKKLLKVQKNKSEFVAVLVKPNDEILEEIKNLPFDYYQLYDCTPNEIKTIKTDYALGFFGLIMQLGPIANWGLNIDKKTIEVDTEKFETNQKGIYAVGDICTYPGKLKLILSGFHEGALAARACFKLARPNEKYRFEFTTSSKTIKNRLGVKSD